MTGKSLEDKAIDIKGKAYVLVSDRIIYFNEQYTTGAIKTELVSDPNSDIVVVKAVIEPDSGDRTRYFTGYSQAVKGAGFINKTAALENAETSAVGRALAMMGIGVIDSVASADEVNKAQGTDPKLAKAKQDLFQAFKKKGIEGTMSMVANIQQATGKETVETVADAEAVIKHVEQS